MTSRNRRTKRSGAATLGAGALAVPLALVPAPALVAGLSASALLVGCGSDEPAPAPPPPTPPTPPRPDPVRINAVLADVEPDARVQFPQDRAPYDRSLARAVARLADALARGDERAMRTMLDQRARADLDRLVESGAWRTATGELEAVRVVYLSQTPGENAEAENARAVLALQGFDGAYTLAWNGTRANNAWTFTGAYTGDQVRARASEWDGLGFGDYVAAISTPGAGATYDFGLGMPGLDGLPEGMEGMLGDMMGDMAAIFEAPAALYAFMELGLALAGEMGQPADRQQMWQMVEMFSPDGASEARAIYEQGRTAVQDRGEKPSDRAIATMIRLTTMQASMPGAPQISEDRIIELLADVLNAPAHEIRDAARRGG